MSPGALLVFWCAVAGLVIVVLAEAVRWSHRAPRLGPSSHARLMAELERHRDD